ncbi:MAG TPA: uridine kinase [Neisseriales bacterium]|nr:uridine kinase [Burkholderiales bacterium]MBP9768112.1 uridine kinase [Burkholderiales bacterium]HCY38351.1 uridine kinase [Neisseriales bacterium]
MSSFIIGVAGGSGSGKSTVTEHIVGAIGADKVAVIIQDNYYVDLGHLTPEQRRKVNFDHPDSFDWELMLKQIDDLSNGVPIEMPTYDYSRDTRRAETITVLPAPIIVIEGLFALLDASMRKYMALRIFVDTADDIRFIRRLQRDIIERGRSTESVIKQYLESVRPMHRQFIEPSKRNAHIIIPHGANKAALEMLVARVRAAINHEELSVSTYFEEV